MSILQNYSYYTITVTIAITVILLLLLLFHLILCPLILNVQMLCENVTVSRFETVNYLKVQALILISVFIGLWPLSIERLLFCGLLVRAH